MRSHSNAHGHSCSGGSCPHPMPKSHSSTPRMIAAALVVLGTAGLGVWGAVSNAAPANIQKFAPSPVSGISIKTVPEYTPTTLVTQDSQLALYTYDFTNTSVNPISITTLGFGSRAVSGAMSTSTTCGASGIAVAETQNTEANVLSQWITVPDAKGKFVYPGVSILVGPQQTKRLVLMAQFTSDNSTVGDKGCTFVMETSPQQIVATDVVTGEKKKVVTSGAVQKITIYPVLPKFTTLQDPVLSPQSSQAPGMGSIVLAMAVDRADGFSVVARPFTLKAIGLKVATTIKAPKTHEPYVLSVYKGSIDPANLLAQKKYLPGASDLGTKNDDVVFSDAQFTDVEMTTDSASVPLVVTLDTIAAKTNTLLRVTLDPSKVVWSSGLTGPAIVGVPEWSIQDSGTAIHF